MENLISQKFTKSLNVHLAFLFVLSLSYIIPFLIFGKITLFYHDTLDSEIVYNSILGKVYRGDAESIKYFLNGEFKVEFLRRLFHPINLLYYFFNPEIAYWINDFTVKILAYFSFYIFAKKISSQIFICGLVSCLYASINDRTLDGFGFAINGNSYLKIPQIGRVIIYDNVEIGSNCTIDRGSCGDTIIKSNCMIDNLVHIAHNVVIGENTIIAGQTGIAGSSIIGKNVLMGGQVGISGHLYIKDNVQIGAQSGVTKNIEKNSIVSGTPSVNLKTYLKQAVVLKQMVEKK